MNTMIKRYTCYRVSRQCAQDLHAALSMYGFGIAVRRSSRKDEETYNVFVYGCQDDWPLPWSRPEGSMADRIKEIMAEHASVAA